MEILRNVEGINMKIRKTEEKYEREVQWMERAKRRDFKSKMLRMHIPLQKLFISKCCL